MWVALTHNRSDVQTFRPCTRMQQVKQKVKIEVKDDETTTLQLRIQYKTNQFSLFPKFLIAYIIRKGDQKGITKCHHVLTRGDGWLIFVTIRRHFNSTFTNGYPSLQISEQVNPQNTRRFKSSLGHYLYSVVSFLL